MADENSDNVQVEVSSASIKQELVEEVRKSVEHSVDEQADSVPDEPRNETNGENTEEGEGQEAMEDDLDDDDDEEEEDEGLNVIIRPITRTLSGSNAYKSVSSNYTNKSLTNVSMGAKQTKMGVDLEDPGDINGNPTLDYNFSFLKDEDKPWKIPGADINDYFNYGFSEETWIQYCEKQRSLRQQYGGSLKSTLTSMNLSKPNRSSNRNPINVIGSNIASDLSNIPSLVMGSSSNLPNLSLPPNINTSRPSLLGNAEKSISLPLTNVPPPPLPATFNPGVPPPNFTVPPPGYNANASPGAPIPSSQIVGGSMFNSIPGTNVPVGMIPPSQNQHPQNILNAMAILQQMNPQQIMAAAGAIPPHMLPGGPSLPGMPFSSGNLMSSGVMGSLTSDGREKTPDSLGSDERDLDRDDERRHMMRQKSRGSMGESYQSSSRHRDTPIKKDREYFEQKDRAREMQRRARDAMIGRYDRGESYRSRRRSRSGSREKDRDRELGRESKRRRRYEEEGSDFEGSDRDRGEEKLDTSGGKSDKVEVEQSTEESRKSRRRRGDTEEPSHHHHSSSKHHGSRSERDDRSSHRERERLPSESTSRRHKRDHHHRETRSRSRSQSTGRESRRPSNSDRTERSRRDRTSRSPTAHSQDEEQSSRSGRLRSKYGLGGDRDQRGDMIEARVQSEVTAISMGGGSDSNGKNTLSRWETEEPGMN